MKANNKTLPNTNITLKEFKELLFEHFKAYPSMRTDYKKNVFVVGETYYDKIEIKQNKLCTFCDSLGIKYKKSIRYYFSKCVVIDLN